MQPSNTAPFTWGAHRTVIPQSLLQKIQAMRTFYERAQCPFTLDNEANRLIKNSMWEMLIDRASTKDQKEDILKRLSDAISNTNLPQALRDDLIDIQHSYSVDAAYFARFNQVTQKLDAEVKRILNSSDPLQNLSATSAPTTNTPNLITTTTATTFTTTHTSTQTLPVSSPQSALIPRTTLTDIKKQELVTTLKKFGISLDPHNPDTYSLIYQMPTKRPHWTLLSIFSITIKREIRVEIST